MLLQRPKLYNHKEKFYRKNSKKKYKINAMKFSQCAQWFLILAMVFCPSLMVVSQDPDTLKLKDFRPVSIYRTPQSNIVKAKYPIIDFHSHDYPETDQEVDAWVKNMDESGVAKSIILSYATGARFDSVVDKYARFKDRFEIWCGFDYTGYEKPGWQEHAIKELERCHRKGAKGVGELGDKGLGEFYSTPTPGWGLHIDHPELKPLLEKCADLKMPVNVHVAEDEWNYLPPDSTNDGLMNAHVWKVDLTKKGILNHDELVATLANAVKNNPRTTFIASHLANCCSDLEKLGRMFDAYPNLYADISARYSEFAPIPRFVNAFMQRYADRLVYGTDMGFGKKMYQVTFRILESSDEHFYEHDYFNHHWSLYGLALPAETLKKIYNGNAKKILGK